MVVEGDESADEGMWRTLRKKLRTVESAVDGAADYGGTGKTISQLFSMHGKHFL